MSLPTPNTRKEQYLNAIATGNPGDLPTPITREEEYLNAIAKNGGGGSGDGDMKKSVYDSDLDVSEAGGIKAFVSDVISGKVDKVEGKGLSTNDYSDTEKGKVADNTSAIEAIVNEYGAKNIANNDATTKTDSGVLFTVNADKSVTVQRQASTTDPYSYIKLFDNKTLPTTLLKLSGCPNVTGLTLYLYDKTTSTRYNQTGDEIEVTPVAGHTYSLVIEALNSADIDTAVTVYPMIRDARITDPTYVPYAMTNRELTDEIILNRGLYFGDTITLGGHDLLFGFSSDNQYRICFCPLTYLPRF